MPKKTVAPNSTLSVRHNQRLRELAETRQKILGMPAGNAMAAIFDHAQPAALVHSFPEADLAFLIHEIGPDEALPLLNLASNRQWEYLLDTEGWKRDQIDFPMTTAWMALLLQADPNRMARWCFEENLEFIELYLFRNIEVRILESDQTPSDLGEGFFSDDDTYYVRFIDYPVSTPAEETRKNARNAMLAELLRRLSIYDHVRYQGLLLEAASVIPAETEEELFRLRNVRLAEKGFVPFHEAVGVYQPITPGDLPHRSKKVIPKSSGDDDQLTAVSLAATFLAGDNLFVRGLKQINAPAALGQLQSELAALCNQVITADQIKVRAREQLATVVEKVSGYIAIGLEQETAGRESRPETVAADLLQHHLLADIFRAGIAGAMDLHWRAVRWRRESWWQKSGLRLGFWDETWMGLLGGLMLDRPQFYDPSQAGRNYRDFKTIAEIQESGRQLDRVIVLDALLDGMNLALPSSGSNRRLTYKNLLLTLWARAWLKLPEPAAEEPAIRVPLAPFRDFYRWLWTVDGERRHIEDRRKTEFLDWLAGASKTETTDLSTSLGTVLESLFGELAQELAPVRAGNLDPRYISLFLLSP